MIPGANNPQVDKLIGGMEKWQAEFAAMRAILLDCPLEEAVKWRLPCYSAEGKNIVIMQDFKNYCALMFFKGVLMKDPDGLLVALSENAQAQRQLRFTSVDEITAAAASIKAYVDEAIAIEQAGREVEYKDTSEFEVPEEFQQALDDNPVLQQAFEALTPGRQRGYLLHFAGARQSKTRAARVDKSISKILEGKGFNER